MSYATRYQAMKRQRADAAASTPEAEDARRKLRIALDRAKQDIEAKYPALSMENIADALDYQQERIAFWRDVVGA